MIATKTQAESDTKHRAVALADAALALSPGFRLPHNLHAEIEALLAKGDPRFEDISVLRWKGKESGEATAQHFMQVVHGAGCLKSNAQYRQVVLKELKVFHSDPGRAPIHWV